MCDLNVIHPNFFIELGEKGSFALNDSVFQFHMDSEKDEDEVNKKMVTHEYF